MGGLGAVIGSEAGGGLGRLIGKKIGGRRGADAGANIGRAAGGIAGAAFPMFKKGGKVKKTGLALVHKNEYILPANAKPTKAQKAIVAKNKKK